MPPQFNTSAGVEVDEVEIKTLTEEVEIIRIRIMASEIKEAFEKAKQELSQIITVSFGHMKNFDYYAFKLRLIEVENF